jgi:hypothetical protein
MVGASAHYRNQGGRLEIYHNNNSEVSHSEESWKCLTLCFFQCCLYRDSLPLEPITYVSQASIEYLIL